MTKNKTTHWVENTLFLSLGYDLEVRATNEGYDIYYYKKKIVNDLYINVSYLKMNDNTIQEAVVELSIVKEYVLLPNIDTEYLLIQLENSLKGQLTRQKKIELELSDHV